MPELPEVTTTVDGLNKVLPNKAILDVWSDYFLRSKDKNKYSIKNKKYFETFKKEVNGETIKKVERTGKNVLIHLTHNKTILTHMKMTGHFLYGRYKKLESLKVEKFKRKEKKGWEAIEPKELGDPFNRFIHLIFTLSNKKHLAFSDMRKFAKIILLKTDELDKTDLVKLGPDPLNVTLREFEKIIHNQKKKIKTVLMDQSVLAGIGNIYSDEILWEIGVNPEKVAKNLTKKEIKNMWLSTKKILSKSISMGGDSMSDYRNIFGLKGNFQNTHKAYRRVGEKCSKKNCSGKIVRKVIAGRSAHFCDKHQKM